MVGLGGIHVVDLGLDLPNGKAVDLRTITRAFVQVDGLEYRVQIEVDTGDEIGEISVPFGRDRASAMVWLERVNDAVTWKARMITATGITEANEILDTIRLSDDIAWQVRRRWPLLWDGGYFQRHEANRHLIGVDAPGVFMGAPHVGPRCAFESDGIGFGAYEPGDPGHWLYLCDYTGPGDPNNRWPFKESFKAYGNLEAMLHDLSLLILSDWAFAVESSTPARRCGNLACTVAGGGGRLSPVWGPIPA